MGGPPRGGPLHLLLGGPTLDDGSGPETCTQLRALADDFLRDSAATLRLTMLRSAFSHLVASHCHRPFLEAPQTARTTWRLRNFQVPPAPGPCSSTRARQNGR